MYVSGSSGDADGELLLGGSIVGDPDCSQDGGLEEPALVDRRFAAGEWAAPQMSIVARRPPMPTRANAHPTFLASAVEDTDVI